MQPAVSNHPHSGTPSASIAVIPSGAAIGAEIKGIKNLAEVPDSVIGSLQDALNKYSVIVIRDQNLSPEEQLAFTRRFGPIRSHSYSKANKFVVPGYTDIEVVSNVVRDGKPIGVMDAGLIWHSDGSFLAKPGMYTFLHAIMIPERDGQPLGPTLFASTRAAFNALPEDVQRRMTHLSAVHSLVDHIERKRRLGNLKRPAPDAAYRAEVPDVTHPVAFPHPLTGEKCLFVSEAHTSRFVGLSEADSDALLKELCEHIKKPEFTYRHLWKKGDVLIWDNPATQHLAISDYGDIPRLMHRTTT